MEDWNGGRLEWWKIGMEDWNGRLEWKIGMVE